MEPRLVVEGLVSNQSGPYYVRLTKSTPGGLAPVVGSVNSLIDNAEPVDNATVIISDDFDQVDTLKYYQVDINDSEYVEYYNKGFYRTTWLKGISGRTYYLKIIDNDKIYNSSAYMPSVPGIDSVGYLKKIVEKDGQEYFVPLLYFKEPQGIKNYYLIQLNEDFASRISSSIGLGLFRASSYSEKGTKIINP